MTPVPTNYDCSGISAPKREVARGGAAFTLSGAHPRRVTRVLDAAGTASLLVCSRAGLPG
ncbi:hypothetical protein ACFWWM_33870 [Streptomyces sp. NPDC058682]|uniref:hypothetical protein n=1 Tax=Streptomyces sp. NPDC058682 TaxID=3346596 RepID=UPI00364D4C5D